MEHNDTEQRAHVKVLSWGQTIDEQERWRDKEACRMQSHEPAQEGEVRSGKAGNSKGGSDAEPAERSRWVPILSINEIISWSCSPESLPAPGQRRREAGKMLLLDLSQEGI